MTQVKGGENDMPLITVNVTMTKTVAVIDAATLTAILTWIQVNLKDKLPADQSLVVTFNFSL